MPSASVVGVRHEGDAVVIALKGTLNFTTVPPVRQAIDAAVARGAERGPVRRVVLNLAGVEYMDSGGVAMLVALRRKLLAANTTLVIAQPQPLVSEVFGVVKLHVLMPIVADDAKALAWEVEA